MGHLTKKGEARIIKIIEDWSEPKLTWPLLVEACKTKLDISRARQSLMKIPAIDMAMKDRKAALKATTEKPGWVKDINEANERIEKLTEANQKLKAVNQKLLERFKVWQANADMHGLSQRKLDQPLVHFRKK
ncbi:MAG: hypothetical protein HOM11_09255 [Methylococcales bacterium]|jgi:hypothetical protein|nr:hypothetical protein [Methylococcales bacterium]MBT7445546.1 hypothetical protein [Methylococcales bacterium]